MLWRASEWSIRQCVRNAMALALVQEFKSIAFPLIGAGSGGFNQERTKAIMEDELGKMDFLMEVRLVVSESKTVTQDRERIPWIGQPRRSYGTTERWASLVTAICASVPHGW